MEVIRVEGGRPIFCWAENIEAGAMQQAENLARLPFTFQHVALMPDCHSGYGMPIGGVLGARNVVIPNAVGVDIGCGMLSVRTNQKVEEITPEHLKVIFGGSKEYKGGLRSEIPVGFNHRSKKVDECWLPRNEFPLDPSAYMVAIEFEAARKQLGTLGGGNHFIELQRDQNGMLWFTIHSGSRNLGKKVADHYNTIAKSLHERWHTAVPPEWDLAFLPADSNEGRLYLQEMYYCVEFAKQSRAYMAAVIKDVLAEVFPLISFEMEINIAHNYASLEHHMGANVWVHRKGATLASEDTTGVIPGSQGAPTFIVKGRGLPTSFNSCSHGAGRRMGRKQAQRSLDLAAEQAKMTEAGVMMHGLRSSKDLDEAPGSYKDINRVMELQQDLVTVLNVLHPIASMKG